jgi:hypothetical protein
MAVSGRPPNSLENAVARFFTPRSKILLSFTLTGHISIDSKVELKLIV